MGIWLVNTIFDQTATQTAHPLVEDRSLPGRGAKYGVGKGDLGTAVGQRFDGGLYRYPDPGGRLGAGKSNGRAR